MAQNVQLLSFTSYEILSIFYLSQRNSVAITKSSPNVISRKSTFKSFTMVEIRIHIDINLWIGIKACVQGLSILDNLVKFPKMLGGNNSIFIEYSWRILLLHVFIEHRCYPSFGLADGFIC